MAPMIIRRATAADLNDVKRIDEQAFPAGDRDLEPAAAGELAEGIRAERIGVAEREGEIVAFLQYDLIGTTNLDIISIAVSSTARSTGAGTALLRWFLDTVADAHPGAIVTTVTSPRNVEMLRLLTRNRFIIAKAIRGYFGDGKDRFYCQFGYHIPVPHAEDMLVVPVQAYEYVFGLIQQGDTVLTGVIAGAQGDFFELCRVQSEDLAGLRASEASISVAESGSIVAGFTFLLGLSFVIPNFSLALQIVLLLATILTTGGLAIFANSSGNLARIRDNTFDEHMKWANLLLEFGGLYPFVIVLAAVVARASQQTFGISIVIAFVASALLAAYEFSPFSLGSRYERRWYLVVAILATVLLPLAYPPMTVLFGTDAFWLGIVTVVLASRAMLQLRGGNTESHRTRSVRRRSS